MDPTVFHGAGQPSFDAATVGEDLPGDSVWLENRHLTLGSTRVLSQDGVQCIPCRGYEVVVCEEAVYNLSVWYLWLARKRGGFRFVLSGYGFRAQRTSALRAAVRDRARTLLLKSADALLVYTGRGKMELTAGGIDPEKVFVLENTLDTEYLMTLADELAPDESEEIRSERAPDGRPLIRFVGRLVKEKRVDTLIEAVRLLKTRCAPVSALIIGEGPETGPLRKAARGSPGISFLPAIYGARELAPYFMAADLLVIPGRVGLTGVHGFSFGLPIVTLSFGIEQSPEVEYVEHGANGWMIDRPDPELFADAIQRLVSGGEPLGRLEEGARATAERYDDVAYGRSIRAGRRARLLAVLPIPEPRLVEPFFSPG